MEQFSDEIKEISKYNDAGYSISRLHQHWVMAENYANSGNLIKWKFRLDSIWRELYPDILKIKSRDSKKAEKIILKNKKIMELIFNAKNNNELYFFLNKRHELLREIQDTSGKGNVYVDEDEEGFE